MRRGKIERLNMNQASFELLTRDQFFSSADFYPVQIDLASDTLLLAELSRSEMKARAFHNRRSTIRDRKVYRLPVQALLSWFPCGLPAATPAQYIFHNAFCGSTLLARCLDLPGSTLVYREPSALATLADSSPESQLTNMLMTLLTRREQGQEHTVIKLNDRCNNMIAQLLGLHPAGRGILLFSDLRAFLVSVLGKPARRQWLQERCASGCADLPAALLHPDQLPVSKDGEAAVRYWLTQMLFFSASHHSRMNRLLPVRANDLINDPVNITKTVADFLGLGLDEELLRSNIAAEQKNHAKIGKPFLRHEAAIQKELLARTHAEEIGQALQWKDALLELNLLNLPSESEFLK